jgi:hypothetical protein
VLPARFNTVYPLDIINRADYTRTAVWAAWAELLAEEPALASRAPRAFLSTARHEGESALFPWVPNATDFCGFDEDAALCDMHTWAVAAPLSDASRAQGGTTGHARLAHAPYDLIIFSQTFEHLYDPPLALARARALLAPSGLVFASLPAWNIAHMAPSHQQGWSPCGAYANFAAAGFDVLRVGWFHNHAFSDILAKPGAKWPGWQACGAPNPFERIPVSADAGRANTVWILARAPSTPGPPPLAIEFAARPLLSRQDMLRAETMRGDEARSGSWPTADSLLDVLARAPAWLDDDVAHVVLSAAFFERVAPAFGAAAHAGGALLVSGRAAGAIARSLLPAGRLREWVPPAPRGGGDAGGWAHGGSSRTPVAGAFITDLFEATADPLAALRGALALLPYGAPVLLACRSADVTHAARPTLGTCTDFGFQQLLVRAGLEQRVDSYGLWGCVDYTRAALVAGETMSLRGFVGLPRAGAGVPRDAIEAIAAAKDLGHVACPRGGACRAINASTEGADAALTREHIRAILDNLLRAGAEAYYSWPAIAYALVHAP